ARRRILLVRAALSMTSCVGLACEQPAEPEAIPFAAAQTAALAESSLHGAAGSGAHLGAHQLAPSASASAAQVGSIDLSRIPIGSEGSSARLISATRERPAAGDGTGAFRTSCDFSHMNFDDPIVFPRIPGASHLH